MRTYDVSGRPKSRDFASRDVNDITDVDGWNYINYNSGCLWSAAGQIKTGLARNGEISANTIVAIPFLAPYRGGTISGVAFHDRGITGLEIIDPPSINIGIYANAYPGLIYPSSLLFQTSLTLQTSPAINTSNRVYGSCSLNLEPCGIYWAVVALSGLQRRFCAGVDKSSSMNLLGFDSELNPQPAWGYSGVYAANSVLPSVFPTGMSFANSNNMPLIFYSFGA